MLEFGGAYEDVLKCLPIIKKEVMHLPRQYICNVIYTKVGKRFSLWVDEQVNIRHRKCAE